MHMDSLQSIICFASPAREASIDDVTSGCLADATQSHSCIHEVCLLDFSYTHTNIVVGSPRLCWASCQTAHSLGKALVIMGLRLIVAMGFRA